MSETVSLRKLYNEFRKSPQYETLSYPYFKFLLMGRLERLPVPGKTMGFVFVPGLIYHYRQVNINTLDVLKAMKISRREFTKRNIRKRTSVPGVLDG